MAPSLLAQWAVVRVVRFPWFWLWAIALGVLGPAAQAFLPLATTTQSQAGGSVYYEVAFLAILAGAVGGLRILHEAPYLLAPLDRLRRLGVESTILTVTAAAFLIAGLVPLALAEHDFGGFLQAELASGVLLAHLHVVACGLVLLRLPIPTTARLVLLPALVWVVPACFEVRSGALAGLIRILDASAPLSGPRAALETRVELQGLLAALRPILALLLAALLLRPPPLPHALRHPG